MLSREDNELYTRVGPGTPMGELFRRFWLPALLVTELAEPDGAPARLRLLGEDLIAFRDTSGKVGIIEERCAHRQASLFFGRNEECGIRCVYHGWKFDTEGRCVDMPNEPADSRYKDKVRLRSYPAREAGDVIWVYMGPPQLHPELPQFEWMHVPPDQRMVTRWHQDSNWAQGMEGEIDASHLSFLHRVFTGAPDADASPGLKQIRESGDTAPQLSVQRTDYGFMYGARRVLPDGHDYWRITQFLLPMYSLVPSTPVASGRAWVPIDDESCWTVHYEFRTDRPFSAAERARAASGDGFPPQLIPGTHYPEANRANDYLIDRQMQRTVNFTGIRGISNQDRAVTESMGPIVDRTKEHLSRGDQAITTARRVLIKAAKDLQKGIEPAPATDGKRYAVRSLQLVDDEADLGRLVERHRGEMVAELV